MDAEPLAAVLDETAEQIYAPLAELVIRRHGALGRPCLVGLCGPQGSGKSTGAVILRGLLQAQGLRAAVLSLDDFYLTRAERQELAGSVHPLLATRGPPGTHDLRLAEAVIDGLLGGDSLALPSFDKATDDRRPPGAWEMFDGPADIVLLEGWCVGARPQPEAALDEPVNALERDEDPGGVWRRFVNHALGAYQKLFARIDLLILLQPPDFATVFGWRREAEARLRAEAGAGGSGLRLMSDAEVDRFVQHYERLTRAIMAEMPGRADAVVELGPQRQPRRAPGNR